MTQPPLEETGRGRQAWSPRQISWAGWRDILFRTAGQIGKDRLSLVAAGVAFYALFAIFPAIIAIISIWGLAFDPVQLEQQIRTFAAILPPEAATILRNQARGIAVQDGSGGTLAVLLGIAGALWGATRGVTGLMGGLNAAYKEDEKRKYIQWYFTALILSAGLLIMTMLSLGVVVVLPAVLGHLGLRTMTESLVSVARWPFLFVIANIGLAILYRFAPSRTAPRWRWVNVGGVVATILWVVASIGFSIFVRNFTDYNETYGSLGAVIILLMWLWLSAFIVLLGAELNAEMEHQTTRDSTRGDPKPLGERGAFVADTVGPKP